MSATPGTYRKSIHSGQWFMIGIFAQRLVNLVTFFVLARLLLPADYGVITIIFTITGFLDSFLTPGFSSALLQKNDSIDEYLPIVWTFELGKSILTGIAIFVFGTLIARFFNVSPAETTLIKISGLLPIISALGNIQQLKFFKELEYKKVFIRDLVGQIAYTVISILFALFIRANAWALFAGYIGKYTVASIATYVLYPAKPSISFRFSKLKSLSSYGFWVYAQNILDFFLGFVDKIFVGRLLNPTYLGFYSRAKDLPSTVTAPISGLLSKVGFSAYVKVQDRLHKIQEGFLKSLDIMLLFSVPFSLLLLLEGGSIISVLLGKKWLEIVVPLKIFSITNIFLCLNSLVAPIFNAVGKPKINFKINAVQLIISPPIFYFAVKSYGLLGAAAASLAIAVLLLVLAISEARPVLKLDKSKMFPSVISVIAATVGAFVVAYPSHFILHKYFNDYAVFAWSIILGILYVIILVAVGKRFTTGPYDTIMSVVNEFSWSKYVYKIPWLRRKRTFVAIIEARMTSSRLPGKVMLPIGGKPALEVLVNRLKRSRKLDKIVVATTTNKDDDVLETLAAKLGVYCFRGSENDVLGRVLGAARSVSADIIVEITGDCPFVDPGLVDRAIMEYVESNVDYASNTITSTFPNGFDVQVFSTKILAKVDALTQDPIDRVHVSYYIYQHPDIFKLHNWTASDQESGPELRVTLDEDLDYQVLCKIYDAISPTKPYFSAADVVQFLRQHPEIVNINKYVRQKEVHEG